MGYFDNYLNNLIPAQNRLFTQQPTVAPAKSILSNYGGDTLSKFVNQNNMTQSPSMLEQLSGLKFEDLKKFLSPSVSVGMPQIQQAQADAPMPPDDSMKPRSVPQGKYLAMQQPLTFAQEIAKFAGWF